MLDYYKNLIKKVVALDTETNVGECFLISVYNEKIKIVKEINSEKEMIEFLKFLEKEKIRIIFCYNMNFDFIAILKKILSLQDLQKLYLKKRIKKRKIVIEYLKDKVGRIGKLVFYDLAQFYNNLSLDTISEKLLKEKKIEIKIKKEKIYEYYLKHSELVKRYCLKDAELAYKLIEYLFECLSKIGLKVDAFYSLGYLAYKYLMQEGIKVRALDEKIEKFLLNFVRGGWVEVIWKGSFKNVYYYDVNSFYPFQISRLLDLSGAQYIFSKTIDEKADYFYIECYLTLKDDINLCFLGLKGKDGVMRYGILKNVRYYLNKTEYLTLKKYNLIENIEVIKVLNVYVNKKEKIFEKIVNKLYENKKNGDEHLSYISKIILNAIYGKFLEKKKDFIEINYFDIFNKIDKFKVNCKRHKFYNEKCLECRKLNYYNFRIEKNKERIYLTTDDNFLRGIEKDKGKIRNVLYAIEVLSNSRVYLYELIMKYFDKEKIIAIFTDGFFSMEKVKNDEILGDEMGMLKEEKVKRLLMVGSGVYQKDNILKVRGYNVKVNLFDIFKKNKKKKVIKIKSKELISLGRSVFTQKFRYEDINTIQEILKDFDINFDKKREFEEWTCGDFLKKKQKGKILIFEKDLTK